MAVSCISIVFMVSAYAMARMPLVILSGGIVPAVAYLAPFADSSKRVILYSYGSEVRFYLEQSWIVYSSLVHKARFLMSLVKVSGFSALNSSHSVIINEQSRVLTTDYERMAEVLASSNFVKVMTK